MKNSPVGKLLLKKPLVFWTRTALGSVFLIAGVDKLLHPEAFARIIYNYQILPDALINVTAVILPWIELLLGGMLLLGLWPHGAALLANVLLAAFWASLVFNTVRGLDVHCGCFSTETTGRPLVKWYLARDSFFMLLGAYLLHQTFLRPRGRCGSRHSEPSIG